MCKRVCNSCGRVEQMACIYMGMGCSTEKVARCRSCLKVVISAKDLPRDDYDATKVVFEDLIHDFANIKITS